MDRVDPLTWEAPKPRTKYDWPAIAERLRAKPMEWGNLFKQGPVSVVNAIRQGAVAELHPNLGFEVTTENNHREAPRLADLYIRYNPEKESAVRAAVREAKKGSK